MHYEKAFGLFIPRQWLLPIQISLQFCNMTAEQIDQQLLLQPEPANTVSRAKKKAIEFEKELEKQSYEYLKSSLEDKQEIETTMPNYDGIISDVLDKHLKQYVSEEKKRANAVLASIQGILLFFCRCCFAHLYTFLIFIK